MEGVEFHIKLTANGQVSIAGPLADKLLCYGMLEAARQAVQNYDQSAQPVPQILLARGGIPNGRG